MSRRSLAFLLLAASPTAAFAAAVSGPAPVPGLGIVGVAITGVAALVIGWWRMRK